MSTIIGSTIITPEERRDKGNTQAWENAWWRLRKKYDKAAMNTKTKIRLTMTIEDATKPEFLDRAIT